MISSQRFRFLDKETNVGTIDFNSLTDNSVYTAAVDSADSVLASMRESESWLGDMADGISDVMDKVANATNSLLKKIKDAIGKAIDKIMSMKLPGFVQKILDSLKSLDLGGVKAFFTDLLKVGSIFLCNNLDFLKAFMLGYSLTENIISGLFIGLLLAWLDRYCKGFTQQEVLSANNKTRIGMLFRNDGIQLSPDNVLGMFSNSFSDWIRGSSVYTPSTAYSFADFLDRIKAGSSYDALQNLRNSEISSSDKKQYIASIEEELNNYTYGTPEYDRLLTARGDLINLPLIAEDRINSSNAYSNSNDVLGSIAINLSDVDLSQVNQISLSPEEKVMYEKLVEFKESVANNPDIQTRDHESGSFANFDFSTIVPELTVEDRQYLESLPGLDESHRYNGLHPTTEVFTEDTMPGGTKRKEDCMDCEEAKKPNDAPNNPSRPTKPNGSNSSVETPGAPGSGNNPGQGQGSNKPGNGYYKPRPVIPGVCHA